MSIPRLTTTGNEDVDYELGLMMKWKGNGSPLMATTHALRACLALLQTQHTPESAKLVVFIDENWPSP